VTTSSPKVPRPVVGRLLVEIGDRALKVAVGQDAFSIGSDDGASLVLDHPDVAARHAVIQRDQDRFEVFDLLSAGGTFLNGERIEAALLKSGDALRIGPVRLVFLVDAPEPAPLAGPLAAAPLAAAPTPPSLRFLDEATAPPPPSAPRPAEEFTAARRPSEAREATEERTDAERSALESSPERRPAPLVPPRVIRPVRFSERSATPEAANFYELLVLQLRRTPFVAVSAAAHALLTLLLWLTFRPEPPPPRPIPVVATVDAHGVDHPDDPAEEPAPAPEDPSTSPEDESTPEAEPDRLPVEHEPFDPGAVAGASEDLGVRPSTSIGRDGAAGDSDGGLFRTGSSLASSSLRRYAEGLRGTGLDVVFVFDATGSMEAVLEDARRRVNEAIVVLTALVPRFRLGAVAFRDRGDEFVVKTAKLTTDHYQVVDFLDGLSAGGGGDRPEAVDAALQEAVQRMAFGSGSRRIVILVGDAPPHADGVGAARSAAATLKARNGVLHAVYAAARERVDGEAREFFADLAQRAGGVSLDLAAGGRIVDGVLPYLFGSEYREEMARAIAETSGGRRAELWNKFVAESDAARVKRELLRRRDSTPYLYSALARNPRPEHLRAFLDVLGDPAVESGARWAATVFAKRVLRAAAPPQRLWQLASELKPGHGSAAEEQLRMIRLGAARIGMDVAPLPPVAAEFAPRPPR
jgi:Mg-chelatase subunit ChlD